jgi:DHA3 family multidrug efflux protein-like MFS transporter
MPFMTNGRGARWIGDWFGTGPDRGIALMFTIAGILGVAATVWAWTSKSYRRLAATTAGPVEVPEPTTTPPLADCAA